MNGAENLQVKLLLGGEMWCLWFNLLDGRVIYPAYLSCADISHSCTVVLWFPASEREVDRKGGKQGDRWGVEKRRWEKQPTRKDKTKITFVFVRVYQILQMTKLTTWSATGLLILTCVFPSVENESHCDFVKLREMLIRVNMEDLREQTHARHYELYRRCKLEEMGFKDTDPDSQPFRYRGRESNTHYPQTTQILMCRQQGESLLFGDNIWSFPVCFHCVRSFLLSSLQETYEAKRKEFLGDLQRKEEEMRQMFVNKVKETEAELKEKEREVS